MAKLKAAPAVAEPAPKDPEHKDPEDIPLPDSDDESSERSNDRHPEQEARERETSIPLSDLSDAEDDEAQEGTDAFEKDEADIIPHQRLTINNTAALKRSLESIQLLPSTTSNSTSTASTIPFNLHMSHTSHSPTSAQIADTDDSISLELALYAQSLDAARAARPLLEHESIPFTRPADYFAEMVKSDEHMGKIKNKLKEEAAGRKASEEAKRMREAKKFGKQVQQERVKEKAKAKRDMLEKVGALKRKRQGEGAGAGQKEDVEFDVALEDAARETKKPKREERKAGKEPSVKVQKKRQRKDEKFGFGGKKRFSKSGDAISTGNMRGFSSGDRKTKKAGGSGGGGGQKQRPGKSRRAAKKR